MEVETTEIFKVESKILINFYQDFLPYLEKRGLLSKFVTNVENAGRSISNVTRFVPSTWVSSAFTWAYSNEGNAFWAAEDAKWRQYIESKVDEVRKELSLKYGPGTLISIVVE